MNVEKHDVALDNRDPETLEFLEELARLENLDEAEYSAEEATAMLNHAVAQIGETIVEHVHVVFADDELFDKTVHYGLKDGGDVTMVTKDHGTAEGRPVVCISFMVQLPDGSLARAQTVITGRNFANICALFRGRYGNNGDSVCTADQVN